MLLIQEHAPKPLELEVLPKIHLIKFREIPKLFRELSNNYWGVFELQGNLPKFKEGKSMKTPEILSKNPEKRIRNVRILFRII
jgi:hypothetical protein